MRLDLAMGQGEGAKACLTERLPFLGFCLTESHCKKMELRLTHFVLSEMRKEGSTHFRPEACGTSAESAKPDEEGGTKPKPKAKAKSKEGKEQAKSKEEEGEGAKVEEPAPKKRKKEKEDEGETGEKSDVESLPW